MPRRRPTKRIKYNLQRGSGQAQVIESPKQLSHILWIASKGEAGPRNVALIWMLFASACRINEVAQLKVKDIYYRTGDLKKSFTIPSSYTKTRSARTVYILVKQQREALTELKDQRLEDRVMLSRDGSFGGLNPESSIFLSKKGKTWRKFSFNPKKYRDSGGNIKTTMVCGSLENLAREIIKGAGVHGGSSHSGRRSLSTWIDRKGYDLKLIQEILGHTTQDMTLVYVEPWSKRIEASFKKCCLNLKPAQ